MTEQTKRENPIIAYFKGAFAEMRKVTWPSRQETWRKSWIVIGFAIAFGVFLGSVDYLFTKLLEVIL